MLPADFELQTRYGVGRDWPIGYDDIEEYYCDAEELLHVSGADSPEIVPRSRPYPQPPHRMTIPDRVLAEAYPNQFKPQPAARPTEPTKNRPACCGNGECSYCDIDAKFTILNEMSSIFDDDRVTLQLGATVRQVETKAGRISGVEYLKDGESHRVHADLVVLGANAMFNPHILLRSSINDGPVGEGLVERVSKNVTIYLDGLDGFGGSTSATGHGYMLYDGEHRRDHAACLIDTRNTPKFSLLRDEPGRWREVVEIKFAFEDLRQPKNFVTINPDDPRRPIAHFEEPSDYTKKALAKLNDKIEEVLKPLPVERVEIPSAPQPTDNYIMGTTVMGDDPEDSVIDSQLRHHKIRDLVVLGTGAFPTAGPANPTLTMCALSLRSADLLFE